jgi:U3 small nucleolar RNA-associated protein 18
VSDSTSVPNEAGAWRDEDDEHLQIDLSEVNRLKKLKAEGESSVVSGDKLQGLLRKRFQNKQVAWAQAADDSDEENAKAGGGSVDDLLRSSESLVLKRKSNAGGLMSGKVDIMRLVDANITAPSNDSISTVKFSKSGNLLMTASLDKHMNIFNIDGTRNEKLLSVKLQDVSIMSAAFRGEERVFLSGRKPYYYSYDISSGVISKIAGLKAQLKSHEKMTVSADGSMIAFGGAGGNIHIVSGSHNTWMYDVKMNSAVKSTTFLNENTLVSSGYDADVYIWDLRKTGKCLHRFSHDDGTSCHALAGFYNHSNSNFNIAVGAESGVVSLYNGSSLSACPTKSKSIMNLTTSITSLAFHPSGDIVAAASEEQKDALKLIHVASGTVFANWPGQRTPLHRISCLDFSPGGAYLAVGNKKGKALLYRLKDYANS